MPSLTDIVKAESESSAPPPSMKIIYLGDSGDGKTGSLASLAHAGYELRIIDFDGGTKILRDSSILKPEFRDKVFVETCQDKMKAVGGKIFPAEARAWSQATKLLDSWPGAGNVGDWGLDRILVIDSTTFAGKAAMNFHLSINGRLAVPAQWQDFKPAQDFVFNLLSLLFSDAIKCHVIAISHIDYMAPPGTTREEREKQELFRGYPTSIGSALGPKMGRFFNDMLLVRDGYIWPKTRDGIALKSSAPGRVKAQYPLSTGLAQYFVDVREGANVAGAQVPVQKKEP
jgi:hypothetical protein